jgi:hypothetical protein
VALHVRPGVTALSVRQSRLKPLWPHFGTEDYWTRETADLVELLAVIRGEADPSEGGIRGTEEGAAAAEEEVLTNKDYFWDWEG